MLPEIAEEAVSKRPISPAATGTPAAAAASASDPPSGRVSSRQRIWEDAVAAFTVARRAAHNTPRRLLADAATATSANAATIGAATATVRVDRVGSLIMSISGSSSSSSGSSNSSPSAPHRHQSHPLVVVSPSAAATRETDGAVGTPVAAATSGGSPVIAVDRTLDVLTASAASSACSPSSPSDTRARISSFSGRFSGLGYESRARVASSSGPGAVVTPAASKQQQQQQRTIPGLTRLRSNSPESGDAFSPEPSPQCDSFKATTETLSLSALQPAPQPSALLWYFLASSSSAP